MPMENRPRASHSTAWRESRTMVTPVSVAKRSNHFLPILGLSSMGTLDAAAPRRAGERATILPFHLGSRMSQ